MVSRDASASANTLGELRRVGLGFQLSLMFANIVVWLALIPLYQLQLPAQIAILDPAHAGTTLGFVILVLGVAGVIATPLFGALSDRTTLSFGRRRTWMVIGAAIAGVALVFMANAQSVFLLSVGAAVFGLFIGAVLVALFAFIPDRVPVNQRATVSAFADLAQPLGTLIGVILIAQVIRSTTNSYYTVAGLLIVIIGLFVLTTHERSITRDDLPPFSLGTYLKGFFVNPRKYPNFWWVCGSRFFVVAGQTIVVTYMLFYLRDGIHYERLFPGQTSAQGVALFQVIYTVCVIVFSIISGIISDRVNRRKPFVIAAGLTICIAFLLLAFVPTWPGVLATAVLFGIGFGIFVSTSVAMVVDVLPSKSSAGKDMGMMVMATALPELLVPFVQIVAFSLFNGYPALFAIAAIAAGLGALCMIPTKRVR